MRSRAAVVLVTALLVAACSVSTPRNGALTVRGGAASDTFGGDAVVGDELGAVDDDFALDASDASTDGGTRTGGSSSSGATAEPAAGDPDAGTAPADAGGEAAHAQQRSGTVPGVTADSIKISIVAGFSGPLAALVNKAYEALQTWQEDVNEAGGIHGRRVVLVPANHKETAAGGVAACKEVQSNGSFVAAVPEGIEANVTAVDCLDGAGIPTIYYAASANPAWQRAFADVITSAQAGKIMGGYVKHHLGGAGKKVGVLYVNQAAYKELSDSFVPEARSLGLGVVSVQAVEPNQASFTAQLLKMREAGVQILVISATAEAIGIVRDVRTLGWNVQITGWGFLFDFVTQAGRDLFAGVTGLRPYATVDSPAYAAYAARMSARGRTRDNRAADLEGFVTYGRALLYGEMLERAGPDPSRESFVAGAETIRGFETGIVPPISYGPSDHIGADAAYPVICCNGDATWKAHGSPSGKFS